MGVRSRRWGKLDEVVGVVLSEVDAEGCCYCGEGWARCGWVEYVKGVWACRKGGQRRGGKG